MKNRVLFAVLFLASFLAARADLSPFGIVYGPKGAFSIKAPEGG